MSERFLHLVFIIVALSTYISVFSQENTNPDLPANISIDSLKNRGSVINMIRERPEIVLSTNQSVNFLQEIFKLQYWNNPNDPLRLALGQLIFEASHSPLDSSKYLLNNFPYDSLNIPWDKFYIWEPLILKIPFLSPAEFSIPVDSVVNADTNVVVVNPDSSGYQILTIPDPFESLKFSTGL